MKNWISKAQACNLVIFTSIFAQCSAYDHVKPAMIRGSSTQQAVFIPPSLQDIATPAAVNRGPGTLQDVVALLKKGDETKDKVYYQQALGILQRIKQLPVFPSKKYSKADFYNFFGYATQMLSKTRSEYMTAEDFYRKALLINPEHIQANKNLGKLYADLYRITGREKFLHSANERADMLSKLFSRTEKALMSLRNDINSFSEDGVEDVLDPDSDWYNTSF